MHEYIRILTIHIDSMHLTYLRAYAPERDWFLVYFEEGCDEDVRLRGGLIGRRYQASWFDPRSGLWQEPQEIGEVGLDSFIRLPPRPDGQDWGLMLALLSD